MRHVATLLITCGLISACGGSSKATATDAALGDDASVDPSAPPSSVDSDPVTTPLTGSANTYNVGPGQDHEEPDTVPWGALGPGDVVNIFHRDTPYAWKLCLRGRGTKSAPIIVNGVTDASGNRPRFAFAGARTASGCNPGGDDDIFDTSSEWSLEEYGGFIIRTGVADAWNFKPGWIVIRNLEMYGAGNGATFTNLQGVTTDYGEGAAGIWIQPSTDVLLENNVIYDNGFGVFTMAKDDTLDSACERITLRSNRLYGNGVVGDYRVHNVYMQAANPIVEGNFIGVVRDGAPGASYKSRSSGEIFRYNYVQSSLRAIDWVYSEDQTPGIATRPDYGVDYAYGNIVVNDCRQGGCAAYPIHYGGDNLGEQENTTELFEPATPYRSQLYFYNNTVVTIMNSDQMWRASVFDLSERSTRVDAWNNIFYFSGTSNFSWVQLAGDLRLHGTNLVFGSVADASDTALPVNHSVTVTGTLLTGDPAFVAPSTYDVRLGASSLAIDAATDVPADLAPNPAYANLPVALQPMLGANGLATRSAADLGALEAE